MDLAIMQPYFFPYLGYFELINNVDVFMFYDDVNFIKKGWVNRNNILVNDESLLVTIPCSFISQNKLINEVQIDNYEFFLNKFLKKIKQSYSKTPFFDDFYPYLKSFLQNFQGDTISEFNIASIKFICSFLNINTIFKVSSLEHKESKGMEKQARLIDICLKETASVYINPMGGIHLYEKEDFKKYGIELKFIEPRLIDYTQTSTTFKSGLSIIDVLMNNSMEHVRSNLMKSKLI